MVNQFIDLSVFKKRLIPEVLHQAKPLNISESELVGLLKNVCAFFSFTYLKNEILNRVKVSRFLWPP